jgi:Leucine-rich repeat (LRR) protein
MTSLKTLSIRSNKITILPPMFLMGLTSLIFLDLTENNLSHIPGMNSYEK